jgi:hypothetical protein
VLDGVNFAKDYEKDSYNKKNSLKKIVDDKNILTTLKKHSYFFKCGILKLKKFNECFKITSKFQSFKSLLLHINGLQYNDILIKTIVYSVIKKM